jgi:UDP-N-acetylmuramoyl-tripeptide--D-alanyl-D-alanine ligase
MTTEQLYQLFSAHPKVETDSRNVVQGCLFFALKGEKFNGNEYAAEALNKGAVYVIIDEAKYVQNEKTVLVNNVLQSLQNLANFHRRRLGLPVIGITGTNGKTTTKELIASVLEKKFRIVYTRGNLNNHIGVPLTLLQMNEETELGVIEMGANHAGEIAELCLIADPDYGIITNIGIAHLEGFGSFEVIKKTKSELYKHVQNKNGIIFYNGENPILAELAEGYKHKISFGEKNADFTGKYIDASPFIRAKLNFAYESLEIKSHLIGSYNFENLLAAACIGNHFGVDPGSVQSALSNYRPNNNRSQMLEKNGQKIIMDAYNANPTSMKASIISFISVFQSPRILILGDMLEMGESALKEHLSVLKEISNHSFEEIFLVGPIFTETAKNYPYKTFLNSEELIVYLKKHPLNKGAVMIKGSRGMQLEKVAGYI